MQEIPPVKISGVMNLYKPVWCSSAQYVYRLRDYFNIRKVGHAGSLDPFAEGVLIGCVGGATRLVERLTSLPKEYRTCLRLGVTNETFDTERRFEEVAGAVAPTLGAIQEVLASFVGEIDQVAPVFSAVKIGGKPSYRLARRQKAIEKPARRIHIYELELEEYAWPVLRIRLRCSRGTYIRAIARDLGEKLECGACCETLVRTAIGPFRIEDSTNLATTPGEEIQAALLPDAHVLSLLNQTTQAPALPVRALARPTEFI